MLATAALLKVGVIFSRTIKFNKVSSCHYFCQVYPSLLTLSGLPLLLLLHSTLLLAAAFFVLKFLPETKNRSLTEIHQHFSRTKEDPSLSSVENLPGIGFHSTTRGLPTYVSETVKGAPGAMVIDTKVRKEKLEKQGEENEEKEVDREKSQENGVGGMRRRSTMVIPSIQPKLQNSI